MIIKKDKKYYLIPKLNDLYGIRCIICHKRMATEHHHCISQRAYRWKSEKFGLVVGLCQECHDKLHNRKGGYKIKRYLQRLAQKMYERYIGTREEWMTIFHTNYLWEEQRK